MRGQVRVDKKYFFEFGENDRVQRVQVRSSASKTQYRYQLFKVASRVGQGCELNRFFTEFKGYLQVRVQVRVLRIILFEFKFEFGENDRVQRVQVRVRSPGLYRS